MDPKERKDKTRISNIEEENSRSKSFLRNRWYNPKSAVWLQAVKYLFRSSGFLSDPITLSLGSAVHLLDQFALSLRSFKIVISKPKNEESRNYNSRMAFYPTSFGLSDRWFLMKSDEGTVASCKPTVACHQQLLD